MGDKEWRSGRRAPTQIAYIYKYSRVLEPHAAFSVSAQTLHRKLADVRVDIVAEQEAPPLPLHLHPVLRGHRGDQVPARALANPIAR